MGISIQKVATFVNYKSGAILAPLFVLCGMLSLSCNRSSVENSDRFLTDSFSVQGNDIADVMGTIKVLDSNTLFLYDRNEGDLIWLAKDNGSHVFAQKRRIKKGFDQYPECVLLVDSSFHFFSLNDNTTVNVYSKGVFSSYTIDLPSPLKSSYRIQSELRFDAYQYNNRVFVYYGYKAPDDFSRFLQSPSFAVYNIQKDSLKFNRLLLDKPKMKGTSVLCAFINATGANNYLYGVFPEIDTLYKINLDNYAVEKVAIKNPDFVLPQEYEIDVYKEGYDAAYDIQYRINNFSYDRLLFNRATNHLCLFYRQPYQETTKGRLPSTDDQEVRCLILNKNGERIRTVRFGKGDKFGHPIQYLSLPHGGIVTEVKTDSTDEDHIFYEVYNL